MAGKRRILIVDDHPLVRQGIQEMLRDEPDLEACGEAEGAAEALRLARDLGPHLVLVDIALKEGSGLELIKQLRDEAPDVLTLALSMHDESLYAERCLRAGARGYVHKQEASEVLLEALRRALDGGVHLSREMSDRLLQRVARAGEPGVSPVETLSDREMEVFRLIGQGLGTREVAERLHLSIKTIETYREHLKEKLSLQSATELVRYAVAWTLEQV